MTGSYPVPAGDEVFVDHIGYFLPSLDAAAEALERMGFVLTPFSVHVNTDDPLKPPVPAGTANRLVMLEEGYLEFLAAHGEITDATPIGQQLRAQMARYVGVHLMAFCVRDAEAHQRRIRDVGIPVGPAVDLQRATEDGHGSPDTVRFTVIRPVPGAMKEGRIQFLRHDRPNLMWQRRWMGHANGVTGLSDILLCSDDPEEAAERYGRYLGRTPRAIAGGHAVDLDRGRVVIYGRDGFSAALPGVPVPTLPWIAGYVLRAADLGATRAFLEGRGFAFAEIDGGGLVLEAPEALGGIIVFADANVRLPWNAVVV